MFRYVISSASDYFYLPIDEETVQEEHYIPQHSRHISWRDHDDTRPSHAKAIPFASARVPSADTPARSALVIKEVLKLNSLYEILGLPHGKKIDDYSLRRAYLARTKECHPDKFPGDPNATLAFQKVSVAYNVLSNPVSKRRYDQNPTVSTDFAATTNMRAEETLRSVVLGVFNDFLDGDMEVVRTLLRTMDNFSPAFRLNDEGIESVLTTLQSIRERLLTCRALSHAVVTTLHHLVETQHSLAQLSYFSVRPRARLSVRLARITLALPLALEDVLWQERRARARSHARRRRDRNLDWEDPVSHGNDHDDNTTSSSRSTRAVVLPRRVLILIEGVVYGLEKLEIMLENNE